MKTSLYLKAMIMDIGKPAMPQNHYVGLDKVPSKIFVIKARNYPELLQYL
jgi:hypothetical protein